MFPSKCCACRNLGSTMSILIRMRGKVLQLGFVMLLSNLQMTSQLLMVFFLWINCVDFMNYCICLLWKLKPLQYNLVPVLECWNSCYLAIVFYMFYFPGRIFHKWNFGCITACTELTEHWKCEYFFGQRIKSWHTTVLADDIPREGCFFLMLK